MELAVEMFPDWTATPLMKIVANPAEVTVTVYVFIAAEEGDPDNGKV
jgi:hypothetical protein